MTSQTPTVSWQRVQNSEDTNTEMAGSLHHHLLQVNHPVTGMLEISVQYSSSVCEELSSVLYTGEPSCTLCQTTCTYVIPLYSLLVEGVLTNISLDTRLSIESRDCIASPENYILVVTFTNTDTELRQSVDISFNSIVEYDVGDMLMTDTVYLIIVELLETTTDTVIDEMNTTIRTPPESGESYSPCDRDRDSRI